jgi:hypothetical protein
VGLNVGDIIEVPEDAYRYGQGRLRLMVTRIGKPVEGWVPLLGHQIIWNGDQSRSVREAWVKVSALPGGTL